MSRGCLPALRLCRRVCGAAPWIFGTLFCKDELEMEKKNIANGRSKKGGSSKVDKIEETILKLSERAGSGESLVSVEHLLIVSQQPCSVVKRKNQS